MQKIDSNIFPTVAGNVPGVFYNFTRQFYKHAFVPVPHTAEALEMNDTDYWFVVLVLLGFFGVFFDNLHVFYV